jgi:Aerotolerance regulator N-terminal/von Willebrand factor type A domain
VSFATPWMLLGLAGVLIPLWLHLRRRREVVVSFPASDLLARVSKRRSPRLKLRKTLLLVIRILIIVLVVMAASRPAVSVSRPGGIRTGASLAVVFVLDDSLSMRLRGDDGKSLFERARMMALVELDRLRPGDAAALVLSGEPVRTPIGTANFDLDRVRRGVRNAKVSYRQGDLDNALRMATRILEACPQPQREVVLISDLAEGSEDDRWPPWSEGSGIGLRVLDADPNVVRTNTAVDHVRISPSPEGVAREVLVEARIANYGKQPRNGLEVVLEVDGAEAARGSLDVPARGIALKRFYHRFTGDGVYRGFVRIAGDQLPEDDLRHFFIVVRQSISVLLIDGDYLPGSYQDEVFYLRRALETPMPGEVPIEQISVDVATALASPLSGKEVVFLAGVSELPESLADRLKEYVRQGGGLFVSSSSSGGSLKSIESVLPARMHSIREAPRVDRPFRIAGVDRSHPLFQPFDGGPTGLEKARIRAHLLVDLDATTAGTTLIDLVGGLPLLMERQVEKGRTMLLTTTVDRDWTDLPIRPGFLPLMQRSVRHLARRLDNRGPRRIRVGQALQIEVSKGMQRLVVRTPEEKDITYPAVELAEKSSVEFRGTDVPGNYRVWAEIPGVGGLREIQALGFSVETATEESNPARVISSSIKRDADIFAPVKGNYPIWLHILIAVFLLLLVETWLNGQGLRRSHVGKKSLPQSS